MIKEACHLICLPHSDAREECGVMVEGLVRNSAFSGRSLSEQRRSSTLAAKWVSPFVPPVRRDEREFDSDAVLNRLEGHPMAVIVMLLADVASTEARHHLNATCD